MEKENLINAYFEGNLTEEQKVEFQKLLESDESFLQEFEFQKNLKKAIAAEERATLKNQFSDFDKKSSSRKIPMKAIAVAASFVLLFALGSILFFNQKAEYGKMYAENFQEFPNISRPAVRSGTSENTIDKAFAAYDQKDYKTAVLLFSKTETDEAYFYKAVSEMMIKNYQNAATDFSKINKENFPLKEDLLWYEALNFIKLNQSRKAKENLEILKSESSFYRSKVEKLISESN